MHHAVVTSFARMTGWGQLYYARDERGWRTLDALSAAALASVPGAIHNIAKDAHVVRLEFHSTSVHGGISDSWPMPGDFVDVHLNDDQRLVAVWYRDPERE